MSHLGKLVRVEREIWVYRNADEKLMDEIFVNVSNEELRDLLFPYEHEDDPEFIQGYILNEKQVKYLIATNNLELVPDFNLYEYILQTHGIYADERIER